MEQDKKELEAVMFFKNMNTFLYLNNNIKWIILLFKLIFLWGIMGILSGLFRLSDDTIIFCIGGMIFYQTIVLYNLIRKTSYECPSSLDAIEDFNIQHFNFNKYHNHYKMILSKMICGKYSKKLFEIIHNIKHLDLYNGNDKQHIITELHLLHKMLMDKTMSGYHIYILLEGEYFTNIKNFINLCESAKNKKELEQKYIQELKLFESYHEKISKKSIFIGEQQKPNIQLYNPIPNNNICNEYLRLQKILEHNKKEIAKFITQVL